MAWAAQDPEKYNELIRDGIVAWADTLMEKAGFDVQGEWLEGVRVLVESLESRNRPLYRILMDEASSYITRAEKEYTSTLLEHARSRDHGE